MAQSGGPHDFRLDRDGDLPLGAQLGWRLRTLIASGRLAAGERLPGVRELAELAGVNVNTVRSVYARLADEGATVSEHGRGTFVADPEAARRGLDRVRAAIGEPAEAATGEAERRKAGSREAARRETAPAPGASSRAATAEARRRASLRAEIAMLERELAALEPPNGGPGHGADASERPRPPAPQLLAAAELEAIRDELVARLQPLRADRTVVRGERERERFEAPREPHRQRAIASSTPRFETGPGGWSLRWRA